MKFCVSAAGTDHAARSAASLPYLRRRKAAKSVSNWRLWKWESIPPGWWSRLLTQKFKSELSQVSHTPAMAGSLLYARPV